jgi:hypothetical protein
MKFENNFTNVTLGVLGVKLTYCLEEKNKIIHRSNKVR